MWAQNVSQSTRDAALKKREKEIHFTNIILLNVYVLEQSIFYLKLKSK